ncbi:patatin-like protein 2 [Dorcoceras hygrometricum]|uniref:Patatin-like protein 2 n=1 Tax=Dorcoceras hygrometricum TaxID=472368 RepID=A0A2Z7B9U5_9LAMI|nr:patatin-like protein 2 [Dorcoceras hygrometricum]
MTSSYHKTQLSPKTQKHDNFQNCSRSHKLFAETFELPVAGLTDLTDVPKDKIFDARSLFSAYKEQVSVSCFKKEMKIEYRLLHDILAKKLFVKAGSFDAVTRDSFLLMTAITFDVKKLFVKAGSFDAVTRDSFLLMTAITFDVKVNWGSLLFNVLTAMVMPGSRQAKGFAIQIGVLLQNVQGLVLSTLLGDIVDYIRGGDAKKEEGSSSRRPLPTPVHQSEGTGDAVRITELSQADIDNANREILERMRNEE